MTRRILMTLLAALLSCSLANGQLLVDFNSTSQDGGPHNDTAGGFSAYDAGHEAAADFVTQSYSAFGTSIGVTPTWSNTTDNRVQQMIDRGNQSTDPATGFDGAWTDPVSSDLSTTPVPTLGLDLVTDFIGIDTRTGNGGNGDWDGTTGTPTFFELSLSGLPANTYNWQSAHIDTEHVHGTFAAWISTDGGTNFSALPDGVMGAATGTGNPAAMGTDFLTANSTDAALGGAVYSANFAADGTNDVVVRFAPYSGVAVHQQIWGMNGVVIQEVVPEPGSMLLTIFAAFGLVGFVRRRR